MESLLQESTGRSTQLQRLLCGRIRERQLSPRSTEDLGHERIEHHVGSPSSWTADSQVGRRERHEILRQNPSRQSTLFYRVLPHSTSPYHWLDMVEEPAGQQNSDAVAVVEPS